MSKIKAFASSRYAQFGAAISVLALVIAAPSISGADVISSAFTTEQTTLVGYLGDAVTLVIALLGLGVGIRFLVKWVRLAGRGS
jgi:uncharacterized membrane protein